jgi:hypothetical protein
MGVVDRGTTLGSKHQNEPFNQMDAKNDDKKSQRSKARVNRGGFSD